MYSHHRERKKKIQKKSKKKHKKHTLIINLHHNLPHKLIPHNPNRHPLARRHQPHSLPQRRRPNLQLLPLPLFILTHKNQLPVLRERKRAFQTELAARVEGRAARESEGESRLRVGEEEGGEGEFGGEGGWGGGGGGECEEGEEEEEEGEGEGGDLHFFGWNGEYVRRIR